MIKHQHKSSGNVLFMILIAIFLIGVLTAAMQSSSQNGNENIDREALIIRLSQLKQNVSEIKNAMHFIFENGFSENDIRFAHPDASADYGSITDTPERQVFDRNGGGANYKSPPSGVNDGSNWEFYGGTHMPSTGSDRAELVAVLPNVSGIFCDFVNEKIGYSTRPEDTSTCVNEGASGRFDNGTQFATSPNITDESSFSMTPALEACIECTGDGSLHYVHVLMTR